MTTIRYLAEVERGLLIAAGSKDPLEVHTAARDAERLASIYAGHAALPHHMPAVRAFWTVAADRMGGLAAGLKFKIEESSR